MPGAREILAHLRGLPDWRLAVATGNWNFAGEMKLAAGGVDVSGIPVVGCDLRPKRTQLMEHALHLSEIEHGAFEHVVYIGDARWDVQAARELGWNLLGFHEDRAMLFDLGATHVLADYRDLDATMDALLSAGVPR